MNSPIKSRPTPKDAQFWSGTLLIHISKKRQKIFSFRYVLFWSIFLLTHHYLCRVSCTIWANLKIRDTLTHSNNHTCACTLDYLTLLQFPLIMAKGKNRWYFDPHFRTFLAHVLSDLFLFILVYIWLILSLSKSLIKA